MSSGRLDPVRDVVCGVVAESVRVAEASGVVVMEDWTAEGELVYEWLVGALGEQRVWRAAGLASNLHPGDAAAHQAAAWSFARERAALTAHPSAKTALLLGGPLPPADLLPLGDLYGSELIGLGVAWRAPEWLDPVIRRAGGLDALDEALRALVDRREPLDAALDRLGPEAAREVGRLYERGRYFRLRPRLVPKLGTRTIGVDLFD